MMMERSRLYHQERKKREPGRVNEDNRMYYALRIERREGRSVRRLWSVIDGTAPRVLASPFRDWLLAYRETSELRGSDELALELGIEARRVRSVLSGESTRVTLDIVDRALTNARWSIHVWGRMVVTIDDLYELVA
jgi:hypothetical protein